MKHDQPVEDTAVNKETKKEEVKTPAQIAKQEKLAAQQKA